MEIWNSEMGHVQDFVKTQDVEGGEVEGGMEGVMGRRSSEDMEFRFQDGLRPTQTPIRDVKVEVIMDGIVLFHVGADNVGIVWIPGPRHPVRVRDRIVEVYHELRRGSHHVQVTRDRRQTENLPKIHKTTNEIATGWQMGSKRIPWKASPLHYPYCPVSRSE